MHTQAVDPSLLHSKSWELGSRDHFTGQVLLAIVFGVLTKVLGVIGLVNGYLQLRRYRLPVADVETVQPRVNQPIDLDDAQYVPCLTFAANKYSDACSDPYRRPRGPIQVNEDSGSQGGDEDVIVVRDAI